MRVALETVDDLLGEFPDSLQSDDPWGEITVAFVSECGFHDVDTPVFSNRPLRQSDLLATENDGDVALERSEPFAMVDHQVAHVYTDDLSKSREVLGTLDGVDSVLVNSRKRRLGIDHLDASDISLVADQVVWI